MLEYLSATGSTNADLAQRLRGGDPVAEGFWLIADRQTAGRGRLGRAWQDGLGNFMGSTLVRLGPTDEDPGALALMAGLAAQEAVSSRVPPPQLAQLKWPNDVLISGAKLAGILLERVGDAVVVGIGVNLASAPELPDRATISLSRFGPAPDRNAFAQDLAAAFAEQLAKWRRYGTASLLERWQAGAHPIGTPLSASLPGGQRIDGAYQGLDASGALRLRLADGTTHIVHAGDISLA